MHLSGSITALATPFTASGALDLDAWARLLARQLDAGTHAVVVAGSTGEAAALDDLEYDTLLAAAVAQVDGRIYAAGVRLARLLNDAAAGAPAPARETELWEQIQAVLGDPREVVRLQAQSERYE